MSSAARQPEALAVRLAGRVRALRARQRLTRAELAQSSGVSPAYLARLEAGRANVSLVVLTKIALALGEPAHRLIAPEALATSKSGAGTVWPERIALIGLRGAGKSTLGPMLAERLDRPFVELNREIAREGGLSVPEVFNMYGERAFRQLERRCLKAILAEHPRLVLATGGGIVGDAATFALLRRHFSTVWLRASPETHFTRVRRQQDRRIASPSLREAAMRNITLLLARREHAYSQADLRLDTDAQSPAASLAELLDRLRLS